MFRQKIPLWVSAGGFALTVLAGWVNAIGFMSAQHQAISHMSGTATLMGIDFAQAPQAITWHPARILLAFFIGAIACGCIIRQQTLKMGRRYGVALSVESALLFAATYALRHDSNWGYYLASMACGLQNAMASSYSGSVIRTTHLTGMITDLGIACGHVFVRESVEWRRFKLYGVLLCGFIVGSYAGAQAYLHFQYDALLAPAGLAGVSGLCYAGYKQYEKWRGADLPRG